MFTFTIARKAVEERKKARNRQRFGNYFCFNEKHMKWTLNR